MCFAVLSGAVLDQASVYSGNPLIKRDHDVFAAPLRVSAGGLGSTRGLKWPLLDRSWLAISLFEHGKQGDCVGGLKDQIDLLKFAIDLLIVSAGHHAANFAEAVKLAPNRVRS